MQTGMIRLGRRGASKVRRFLKNGHECVVHEGQPTAVVSLAEDSATASSTLRARVPASVVDQAPGDLVQLPDAGDIVVDGGKSRYGDDMLRGAELQASGIHYLDVKTSGGVAGLERGCRFGADARPSGTEDVQDLRREPRGQ